MAEDDKGSDKTGFVVDMGGLDGLFKGLGDLLDKMGPFAEKMDALRAESPDSGRRTPRGAPPMRTGQFKVKGLGDQAQGVWGVSVRNLADGVSRVESFGNIHPTEDGPVVADVREPLVDVFDEAGEIVLVAEMPGANEEDVTVELHGDVLALETSGERRYAREVLLPAAVDPESMQKTFRNGILEVKLKKAAE
jgi:HSP20 family protein